MLRGHWSAGGVKLTGYLEADFLNLTPGESLYRLAAVLGQARTERLTGRQGRRGASASAVIGIW